MSEWLVVYETGDVNDAHIVAGRLQVDGIRAIVHRQAGAAAFGITVGSLGVVSVLVPPEDYQHALDILEPDEPQALSDTTDAVRYLWEDDADEQHPD